MRIFHKIETLLDYHKDKQKSHITQSLLEEKSLWVIIHHLDLNLQMIINKFDFRNTLRQGMKGLIRQPQAILRRVIYALIFLRTVKH